MSLDVWLTYAPDDEVGDGIVFERNMTHNLGKMAAEAGLYEALWRPDEIGITHARDLVGPLAGGLATLEREPDRFREFNPANGWGDYEGLVDFVRAYAQACVRFPEAAVRVSR